MSTVPQPVLDLIRLREGCRMTVYGDTTGNLTGGIGHKITAADGMKGGEAISQAQIDTWFANDTAAAYRAAMNQAAMIGVNDPRLIDGLTPVNFQLGAGWYKGFRHTWEYLLARSWNAAADEAADSDWFKQTPVRVEDFQNAVRSLYQPIANPSGALPETNPSANA